MDISIERRLPEELLDYIVSWTGRDTLLSLCRVSRTMQRLVIPRLYSRLELDRKFDLARLAYLIFTSNDHAALVTRLYVRATWRSEEGIITRRPRWVDHVSAVEEEQVLRTRCAEIGFGQADADWWYNNIKHNDNEDAILALLLVNLPGLQRLDIDFGDDEHAEFYTLFTQVNDRIKASGITKQKQQPYIDEDKSGIDRVPRFGFNMDVMIKGSNEPSSFGSTQATTFLQLPNTYNLFAWKLVDTFTNEGVDTDPFARLQPQSCEAKSVELRMVKLQPVNLEYLMAALTPGKLKSFNCEIGDPRFGRDVDHSRIMRSLAVHHDTLEQLTLSTTEIYPYRYSHEKANDNPCACSFAEFSALKRLKVAPAFIWGHEGYFIESSDIDVTQPWRANQLWRALPASLEQLWFTRAHSASELPEFELPAYFAPHIFLPSLHALLDRIDTVCPNLNRLVIQFPLKQWKKEWLRALAAACNKALHKGIEHMELLVEMGFLESDADRPRDWGWNEGYVWKPCKDNYMGVEYQFLAAKDDNLEQELVDMKKDLDERIENWRFRQEEYDKRQEQERREAERGRIRLWRITM